ncbi:MAG: hypothetical protein IKQ43_08240 [Treponema sp.]|nr:hypothetical protein [Treponema sp.]MBR7080793.1 hypothetical protein [Treponema sp.]
MKKLTNNYIEEQSFFTRLVNVLLGRSKDERYIKLKSINRTLWHEGYKYYSFRKGRVTPQFAKFLYSVYEIVAPLREFFLKNNDNEYYKKQILVYAQTDSQRDIAQKLSPASIKLASTNNSIKAVAESGQKLFAEFRSGFSAGEGMVINEVFQIVLILKQFCVLDYYACLKKFCFEMEENTFTEKYKFISVPRDYVADFIIDFINYSSMLLEIEDFHHMADFLKTLDGWEQNKLTDLLNLLEELRKMKEKRYLKMIGALMSLDPDFTEKSAPEGRDIVRPYVENIYQMFRSTVQEIIHEKKLSQFNEYLESVFSYQDLKRLRHYNDDESKKYESRGANGFAYCNAAMYVQAFIKKYGHGELEQFMSIFQVAAHSYIPSYIPDLVARCQDLYDTGTSLFTFDQHLDTDFSEGYKLKNLLENCRNDEKIVFKLSGEINEINSQVNDIIRAAIEATTDIGKLLAALLDDRLQKKTIISNWHEVEKQMQKTAKEVLEPMITHFKNFVNLMKEYQNL